MESESCISCNQVVRPRQEAVQCDGCDKWQHRTCDTGITRYTYRRLVQGLETLIWWCYSCRPSPTTESTRLSAVDHSDIDQQDLHNGSGSFNISLQFDTAIVHQEE